MRLFAIAVLLVSTSVSYADDASPGREAFHALVIMAPEHPLIVRLDVVVKRNGDTRERELDQAWRAGAIEEFHSLDKDQSGDLSNDELSKAAWIRHQTQTSLTRRTGLSRLLSKVLAAKEGADEESMSPDLFLSRRAQREPWVKMKMAPMSLIQFDRLWQLLDRSNDQWLDGDELDNAGDYALRLDVNANQLLERNELRAIDNPLSANRGNSTTAYNGKVCWVKLSKALPAGEKRPPLEELVDDTPSYPFNAIDDLASRLANAYQDVKFTGRWQRLLEQYDGKAGADDGKLEAVEWNELLLEGPDCDAHCKVVLRKPPANNYQPIAWNRNDNGNFQLVSTSLNQEVEAFRSGRGVFVRGAGAIVRFNVPPPSYDPLQNVEATFDQADGDKNEYLELKEAQRYYPFNVIYAQADADNNGKLFKDELIAFVKDIKRHRGLSAEIIVNEQGRMLFPFVDANGDQALDVRERREITASLARLDVNSDGKLSSEELPLSYEIGVRPGLPSFLGQVGFEQPITYYFDPQPVKSVQGVPEWFSLIDRNKDGFLQREEYPGKSELFKKMDADGDGIVDAKEAAAAAKK